MKTASILNFLPLAIILATLFTNTYAGGLSVQNAQSTLIKDNSHWLQIRDAIFAGAAITEDASIVQINAPERAQDPGMVPLTVTLGRYSSPLTRVVLVVDQNPAPMAAEIAIAPNTPLTKINTNIRVNEYSMVRAIAEYADGTYYTRKTHVKATGGCSAASIEEAKSALKHAGETSMEYAESDNGARATLKIRHPNFSGFQLDQLSLLYIPAFYVNKIEFMKNDAPIITVDTNFSLSENPQISFDFSDANYFDESVRIRVSDSKANTIAADWNPLKNTLN